MDAFNSVLLTFLLTTGILLSLIGSSDQCDTKWIRLVYMLSCGQKKREIHKNNGTFSTAETFGRRIVNSIALFDVEDEEPEELLVTLPSQEVWEFFSRDSPESIREKIPTGTTFGGMREADTMYILEDMLSDRGENEHHRREISGLLEKCCRVPPISSCSAKDFVGACK